MIYKVKHGSDEMGFSRLSDARAWARGEAVRQCKWQGLDPEVLEPYGDLLDGDEQEGICPDGDPGAEWPVIEKGE